MTTAPDTLRLQPELRATHLRLRPDLRPARVLYLQRNYDLRVDADPAGVRQVTARQMLRAVWESGAGRLELWEPLWMRYLALHVAAALLWRLRSGRRRRPVLVYAMENSTLASLLGAGRRLPAWVVRGAGAVLGAVIRLCVSRIVFATEGARETYHRLPAAAAVPWRVVTDIPRACPACGPGDGSLVLVGRLTEHKGVRDAMRAWEVVESAAAATAATFVVAGGGPLAEEVATWAARRPDRRRYAGELPHDDAVALVERSSVLVLPSRRRRRWREQVGLPIREALAHGLTVVTTSETGLASWLTAHEHHVVPPGDPARLAVAVAAALDAPLPREAVRADLPDEDARVAANRLLHAGW